MLTDTPRNYISFAVVHSNIASYAAGFVKYDDMYVGPIFANLF